MTSLHRAIRSHPFALRVGLLALLAAPGILRAEAAPAAAAAAPAGAANSTTDPAASASARRVAVMPPLASLRPAPDPVDPRSLGPDRWTTLSAAGTPVDLLHRAPAQAQALGVALLVSHRSGGGHSASRATGLRSGLARLGFHTYLLALEPLSLAATAPLDENARTAEAQALAQRVQAAAEFVAGQHSAERSSGTRFANLLISEGPSGRWLRHWSGAGMDALVFVDVPEPPRREDNWLLSAGLPTLLVQTSPLSWAPEQPLGASTELHLLPRQPVRPVTAGSRRAAPDLVLRTVQGWVQRRFAAASKRS